MGWINLPSLFAYPSYLVPDLTLILTLTLTLTLLLFLVPVV